MCKSQHSMHSTRLPCLARLRVVPAVLAPHRCFALKGTVSGSAGTGEGWTQVGLSGRG